MTKIASIIDLYKAVEPLLAIDADVKLGVVLCDLRKKKQVIICALIGEEIVSGGVLEICLERGSDALNLLQSSYRILNLYALHYVLLQEVSVQRYRKLKLLTAS